MGVPGLLTLFEDACEEQDIDKITNSIIVIDYSIMLFRSLTAGKLGELTDSKGKKVGHIVYLLNLYQRHTRQNNKLIFVFDGLIKPKAKQGTIEKRKAKRMKEFPITSDIIKESKTIISLLGYTYVISPDEYEAEQICALLANKYNGYSLTSDSDILVFGSKKSLIPIKGSVNYWLYDLDKVHKKYDITQKELVKIAIALGCDYIGKIEGVGIKSVIPMLKNDELKFTDEQLSFVDYFLNSSLDKIEAYENTKNLDELRKYLHKKDFKDDYIDIRLKV